MIRAVPIWTGGKKCSGGVTLPEFSFAKQGLSLGAPKAYALGAEECGGK